MRKYTVITGYGASQREALEHLELEVKKFTKHLYWYKFLGGVSSTVSEVDSTISWFVAQALQYGVLDPDDTPIKIGIYG